MFSSLADAILVSGPLTGHAVDASDLEKVREALPSTPLFANTGVGSTMSRDVLAVADGCVIGTHFKIDGDTWKPSTESGSNASCRRSRRCAEAAPFRLSRRVECVVEKTPGGWAVCALAGSARRERRAARVGRMSETLQSPKPRASAPAAAFAAASAREPRVQRLLLALAIAFGLAAFVVAFGDVARDLDYAGDDAGAAAPARLGARPRGVGTAISFAGVRRPRGDGAALVGARVPRLAICCAASQPRRSAMPRVRRADGGGGALSHLWRGRRRRL